LSLLCREGKAPAVLGQSSRETAQAKGHVWRRAAELRAAGTSPLARRLEPKPNYGAKPWQVKPDGQLP